MKPSLLTADQLFELATLMAGTQDQITIIENTKLKTEKLALERALATAQAALRDVRSRDDQAEAWGKVFNLCLRMGMNTDQDETGTVMVLEFIAGLKSQAASGFFPCAVSEHRPITYLRDTSGDVIELIPGRTVTDITLRRHDGAEEKFCDVDQRFAEFILAPPKKKPKIKSAPCRDEDDL